MEWNEPALKMSAQRMRKDLLALHSEKDGWPWDTEQEFGYVLAVAAIEQEWTLAENTLKRLTEDHEDIRGMECIRLATIELCTAGRVPLALDFRRRFATGDAYERTGAWLAGEYMRSGNVMLAEKMLSELRTAKGKLEALTFMVQAATLQWLGRPKDLILDWMDPLNGL
jgi:hypothetical protein